MLDLLFAIRIWNWFDLDFTTWVSFTNQSFIAYFTMYSFISVCDIHNYVHYQIYKYCEGVLPFWIRFSPSTDMNISEKTSATAVLCSEPVVPVAMICEERHFQCKDKSCIIYTNLCDGILDCRDGES